MNIVNTIYPNYTEGEELYDYQPILNSLGEILLQIDDDDYSGDSRILIKKDNRYGILIFGWGSCSGCDALQACDNTTELEELIFKIESDVKWFDTKNDVLNYLKNHDWIGDYSFNQKETKDFLNKAYTLLDKIKLDK